MLFEIIQFTGKAKRYKQKTSPQRSLSIFSVFKMLSVHAKTQSRSQLVFKFLRVEESFVKLLFNLVNIYYFPSCSGGRISLHHSITPSLPVRHLETWGSSHMKEGLNGVVAFTING